MDKRILGDTGKELPLLGMGAMRLPLAAEDSQEIDSAKTQALIDYAMAHDVNYFDTGYAYHYGNSEGCLGRALKKHPRDSFFLADKMPIWLVRKSEDLERIFSEQLERCQVDYFDFYLAHCLDAHNYPFFEKHHAYEFLMEKKARGIIRHLGFSFHDTPELLQRIVGDHSWDFAQIQLNYLDWELQRAGEQYEILQRHNLPVIVMEPVRGGALAQLPPDTVEMLQKVRPGASAASWALRYAASLPQVVTILSGMTTMEQLQDNVTTLSGFQPLSGEERVALDKALLDFRASGTVPCTGCRYCMDCPSGVEIPKVFASYNQYRITKNKIGFGITNGILGKSKLADKCTGCGVCVPLCPQGIDIPLRMREVASAYGE